jgi:hypothetical protein
MVRPEHVAFFKQAHEKIQQFYNNNPSLDYLPTSEEQVHAIFDQKNIDPESKIHIEQIHRIRRGGLRREDESVYFYEKHSGHDHRGNEIEKFIVNGKYDIPVGQYQFNELTGQNSCVGIARHDRIYPITYNTKLLDDLVEKGQIDGTTTYYIETQGGRIYSGFEYEDFHNMSFDDLVTLGKTGNKPGEKEIEVKTKRKETT